MPRPDNGLPEDIREHMRLMCDIIALGFQTDKTRVATLLLCRDISGLFYPFLDVRTAHHAASHDDKSGAYERVTRLLRRASSPTSPRGWTPCPRARARCSTTPACCSSTLWSGSEARLHQGAGAPGRRPGRDAPDRPRAGLRGQGDDRRKLCSLYLSIMDRMGVKLDRFGDADERLADL